MPLPPSGDTGEEHGDHDPTGDPIEFRPPLPPEDRIWRHPSEVAATAARPTVAEPPRSGGHTAALVTAAALIGATLSIGLVAVLGGFDTRTRIVERQVAIQPVTNSEATEAIRAITERTSPAVAGVYVTRGGDTATGTAIVIRSDGHLLTTAALVTDADSVVVRLEGWPMTPAEIVGVDEATDLAVLHIDADGLETVPLGTADGVRVGHAAIVMGHADGGSASASVDRTVISALDRRLRTAGGTVLHGMILLDDPPAADAHGGPLLDAGGAVIGIASGVPAADDQDRAYGVATPIDVAVHAADQLIEYGHVRHVWLGIEGTDLDAATASDMGLSGGAKVEAVLDGSPAAAAGLAEGDVVVGIDDARILTMSQLIAHLRGRAPGDEIVLRVHRGDEAVEITAALAERDD
ncbi:S1C family serine protease [Actinospongicola halichondriae]|uniref:S1C family serine protease n=1 Tax=Actinospongicola halichondriae TaxID=3236844 RepID=UPI003D40EE5C